MQLYHFQDIVQVTFILLLSEMVPVCFSKEIHLPKLILISMDGFRYNYLDKLPLDKITNFTYLIKNGVKAKFIKNVFPTVTYPNHMTIATGLYPESHGVVDNVFWDPYLEDKFDIGHFRQNFESKWFDSGGEPIWVTNQNAGSHRDSGVIWWPTGVAAIKSYMPRVMPADEFNETVSDWKVRVDTLIRWFRNDKENIRPINLGILHFSDPDLTAHKYGPDNADGTITDEVQRIIFKLDDTLGYLKHTLVESNLWEEINLIVTADHGHTNLLSLKVGQINLDDYNIDPKSYTTVSGVHNVFTLEPTEGTDLDKLHRNLSAIPKIYVYRKCDKYMSRVHYCNNRRIMKFILEAKEGHFIGNTKSLSLLKNISKGSHGYDQNKVPNMRPFFIGFGQAFKKGIVSEPFESVDIYPLMCHILGIQPAPNNGSLDNVHHLLDREFSTQADQFQLTVITLVVVFAVLVFGLFFVGALRQHKHPNRKTTDLTVGLSPLLADDKDGEESNEELL
ncbi:ectonucleotide pyrophosphatase/phosphodiesterase family member 5-like [Mytilus trossulus]|uniref:ectonucleotide pyrophosphatase/phosphodiesterase family member 5-like n=1 Tax=Mytilus trossulus TaxID=6551 RepID=UPI003007EE5F